MENVPTEYIYSKSVVDMYIESIKSNTSITMVQKDSLGEWYVLTYPIIIECADGTIIQAIVETGIIVLNLKTIKKVSIKMKL